jgi:hypothetical protein
VSKAACPLTMPPNGPCAGLPSDGTTGPSPAPTVAASAPRHLHTHRDLQAQQRRSPPGSLMCSHACRIIPRTALPSSCPGTGNPGLSPMRSPCSASGASVSLMTAAGSHASPASWQAIRAARHRSAAAPHHAVGRPLQRSARSLPPPAESAACSPRTTCDGTPVPSRSPSAP